MDKRKGYVLLLISAGVRNSVIERKKSRRVDKIKHIFLVLILPTKSVFKIKHYAVYNIHRLAWASFACGTT
jgi:hypothetical protein